MATQLLKSNTKLNEQQKKFCREYLKDYSFNGTQSAINAGYSKKSARSTASRLLVNPQIQEYLKELVKMDEDSDTADIREISMFLTEVLRGNVKDTVVTAQGLREAKTQVKDRLKAGELLGKRHGMFIEKVEVENKHSKIDELTNQIDKLIEKNTK